MRGEIFGSWKINIGNHPSRSVAQRALFALSWFMKLELVGVLGICRQDLVMIFRCKFNNDDYYLGLDNRCLSLKVLIM